MTTKRDATIIIKRMNVLAELLVELLESGKTITKQDHRFLDSWLKSKTKKGQNK